MVLVVGGVLITTGCRKSCDDRVDVVIDKIAKKLDLSEEQSGWLAGFKADIKADIANVKKEKDATHKELRELFINGELSETFLNDLIEMKKTSIQGKTSYVAEKLSEIHTNLTAEQRNSLVEMAKKFHEKKEKRKKRCRFFKSDRLDTEKISSHITENVQDKLDLTDGQNEWLETFVAEIIENPALKAAKEQIHSAKKEVCETLLSEFTGDSFDAEKTALLIKNNLPLNLINDLAIASKVVEVQEKLTMEQRTELVSLIDKHKSKRKDCWSKRHCAFK